MPAMSEERDEPTKLAPKIQVEVPEQFLALATNDKAVSVATGLLEYYQADFERALSYELTSAVTLSFGSFLSAVKEDVGNSKQLQLAVKASPGTLISSLLFAAQCKLLPGARYKKCYLIPRKMNRQRAGRWDKIPEVTAMLGYHGIAEMIQRCPRVHSAQAFLVYEGEEFGYEPGSGKLHHKWSPKIERHDDAIVAAYAKVVITEHGSVHPVHDQPIVWPMTRAEILKIRDRSEAYRGAEKSWDGKAPSKDSPWHTDLPAMMRKTPFRAIGSNGSVPLDMGTGGLLARDSEGDAEKGDEIPLPKPTRAAEIREHLGLDQKASAEPFDLAEHAEAAIAAAKTRPELEALLPRMQEFERADREQVAFAYQRRRDELAQ